MDIHTLLIIGHIVGVALGAGGATSSDVIFMRSISDGKLDSSELRLMRTMTMVVWAGLSLLILSGWGFLLLNQIEHPGSPFFISEKLAAKLTIVTILLINGILMTTKTHPIMESLEGKQLTASLLRPHMPFLMTAGAVSAVSWYGALFLGAAGRQPWTFAQVFGIYAFILLGAICVSQLMGQQFLKRLPQ